MNLTHRIAAGLVLVAAPAVIFLGAATAHADAAPTSNGPTAAAHHTFPQQHNFPQPGTPAHHHHQHNR